MVKYEIHLYSLKDSTNVKIAMQCFENFGGNKCPPLVARLVAIVTGYVVTSQYDVIFKFANQRFGEVC